MRASVGIISCNRVDYLKAAIESIHEQTVSPHEVIIVDDGSTDGTEEYVRSLGDAVRYFRHETTEGRPSARNDVVKNLTGDVLIWLDDDDRFAPNLVEAQVAFLETHPEYGIAYVNHVACDDSLQPQQVTPSKSVPAEQVLMQLIFENFIPNGGAAIRKEVFDTVGAYDMNFPRGQDYQFWARAAIAGVGIGHNNQPLYFFRFHQNNLGNPQNTIHQSEQQCRVIERILSDAPIEKIFPMFNWESEARQSAARALSIVARVFFDHDDNARALECLDMSLEYYEAPEVRITRAYVLRAMKDYQGAAEAFADALAKIDQQYQGLFVDPSAPRGSAAVAKKS